MEPVESAYYSKKEIAKRLNRGRTWLNDNLPKLIANGFPSPDYVTGQFRKDLVEAWIRRDDPPDSDKEPSAQPPSVDKLLAQKLAQRRQTGRP